MKSYQRQNVYKGALLILVSTGKYVDLAVQHGMAVNLEAEDQRGRVGEKGQELLDQWEAIYQNDYREMASEILEAFWSAFWIMTLTAFIATGIGIYLGKIEPSFPIDWNKVVTFGGSFLIGWATLMELGGNIPVWDGKAFPQLTHTMLFKIIFTPGVFLILTTILL